jgi:hypothetical protein
LLNFVMNAVDRDIPLSVLDIGVINRMSVTVIAARPAIAVMLLCEPFPIGGVGVF